jgi:GlpG protein
MIRYQEKYTYPIGDLRDYSKGEEIKEVLSKRKIEVSLTQDTETNEYHLACNNEDHLEESRIVYLQVMGLYSEPYRPDPAYQQMKAIPLMPVSMFCILFSVLIFLSFYILERENVLQLLRITNDKTLLLPEVLGGEVYRLLTPIFIHFNFMHILFNLMWLKDLGKTIEKYLGSSRFIILILVLGISSNLLQYIYRGPHFGGMSGVLYGLLGFLWMHKICNPKSQLVSLPKRDIYMMVGWFVLCMTGLLGPIANLAHGMGLTLGMLIGLWPFSSIKKLKWSGIAIIALAITMAIELIKINGILFTNSVVY